MIIKNKAELDSYAYNGVFYCLHNAIVVNRKYDPYVITESGDIIADVIYKFSCCSNDKKYKNVSLINTEIDTCIFLPTEQNYYHSTVYSVFHLSYLPKNTNILTNNSTVLQYWSNAFSVSLSCNESVYRIKTLYLLRNAGPYLTLDTFNIYAFEQFKNSINLVKSNVNTKIYLDRGKNIRTIENNDEFIEFLTKQNFQIINPNTLKIKEQIQIFSNASVIIGVHGAAFTNIIFCNKNCKIYELKHELMYKFDIHKCYSQLASLCNLNYNEIVLPYVKYPKRKLKNYNLLFEAESISEICV